MLLKMRHSFVLSLLFLSLFACLATTALALDIPAPPELTARSYVLVDFNSKKILAEKESDVRIEPASITKIMTAYVVYKTLAKGDIKYSDLVTISERAWRMEGSRMFIEVNKQVSVEDLLKGLIIQSGNDASVALAEHIAGSEEAFVNLMNQEAKILGMSGTNFMNSTGWPDDNHFTTAQDIVLMTIAMIDEFPKEYELYKTKSFVYNNIEQFNRNRMIWKDASVDGVKTGHTESAGYCLVTSALRDGMRLVSVVTGTTSDNERSSQTASLINYGYRFYETKKLYDNGKKIANVKVWKGKEKEVALGLIDDLYITYPRGEYDKLDATIDVDQNLVAPIANGQNAGMLNVKLADTVILQQPLSATKAVEKGGFIKRTIDSVRMKF